MQTKYAAAAICVQLVLTLSLYLRLLKAKVAAYKEGTVNKERVKIHMDAWPDKVVQINNSLTSQYQIPVLFYVLVILALTLGHLNWPWVVLSWVFVLSRFIHMIEHTGRNEVKLRMPAFTLGTIVVSVMIVLLAYQVWSVS